ncbi:MAG: hypothetical protein LHW45_09985 [Candidatus Cloacimonetes bacterium]|jgi:hypothetical protein|nr:hypothetical protein [Candidatus Cloacimonadota bacterium]MDY0367937.1 hypothetical protein [Candidatus Syntrophosphaera sp.]
MRLFLTVLTFVIGFLLPTGMIFCALALPSDMEIATGPDGLLQMEEQGKVTVLALGCWGRLPDENIWV